MINLKNYARLAEQKKYGYFNKINEDNVPNIDLPSFDNTNKDAKPNLVNAKLVMSGEVTNSEYSDEWNQLVDSMEANKIKYANSNTEIKCNVIITRDGKPFAEIEYYIFHGKVAREMAQYIFRHQTLCQYQRKTIHNRRLTKKLNLITLILVRPCIK